MKANNGFYAQYLCFPLQNPEQQRAMLAAEDYHRECEYFDRLVCRHKNSEGIAMPSNGREMGLINRNARKVREEVLIRHHISIEDFREALKFWKDRP